MSHADERNYLEFAPQPLKDAAMLMLDTGLRIGELTSLEWPDLHLQPVGDAKFGFIHVRNGKSKNATAEHQPQSSGAIVTLSPSNAASNRI